MFTRRSVLIIVLMLLLVALAACGGGGDSTSSQAEEEAVAVSSGDPDAGCIACHGPGGEGIEGLGKAFTTSEFLRERSDEEMLEFIKVGRPSSDPLNTTGVDMPPKGGNPALTDDQIIDIVAFVRTLHE
jgi:disulfide bond formation protein DsbB